MSVKTVPVRGPVPWRLVDLLVLWATFAVGGLLLVLAWWGASATADQSSQVAWLNLGVAGLIVAGAGATLWVLAGRRAIGARRLRLLPEVAQPADSASDGDTAKLVSAPTLTRYHRESCPMVSGKHTRAATEARHRAAGREPCGVCRPAG